MEDEFDGLKCEECGTSIDESDPEHFHEPSGWYWCPECGHDNTDQ